jgi:hypothetical protein
MEPQREKMLDDWVAIRNAIIRAEAGELLVKYMRESDFVIIEGEGGEAAAVAKKIKDSKNDKIVGIYVDLVLKFPEALDRDFTKDEIKNIRDTIAVIVEAQDRKEKKA